MALTLPSSTNVFVPSHKATGGLMTGYSRNPKSFPINKYAQIIGVDKPIGYYATWNSRQAARIRSTAPHNALSDFAWKDGHDAPIGSDNLESFAYVSYETHRYCFPFTLGDMTVKAADWDVLQAHSQMAAMQAMTGREVLAYSVWGNVNTWADHVALVDGGTAGVTGTGASAAGTGQVTTVTNGTSYTNAALLASTQNCSNGTTNTPNLKKVLNRVRRRVELDTLGVIQAEELSLVVNPYTAMQIAESQEIHAYLSNSPFALAQQRGGVEQQNGKYGLPDQYAEFNIVVDNTVIDNAQRGATDSMNYMIADGDGLVCSRVGGLEGIGGGPAHSTLGIFYYNDDMTVESMNDVNNRLTRGRVVSNFTCQVLSYYSGFYLKGMLG